MIIDQLAGQRDDVLCLVAIKADGLDQVANLLLAKSQHFLWRIGQCEKLARSLVDTDICRLSRKHDSDQQSIGIDVLQLAFRLRLCTMEGLENRFDRGLINRFGQPLALWGILDRWRVLSRPCHRLGSRFEQLVR